MLVDYLVSTGMERERLVAKGYGESRPIANNLTPEGQRLNRRIDIRIIR
jgi:outer membrane protein OmpA-like peptidoglycan-associated protein